MKLTAVAESMFFIGFTSIHFVNLSTATRICVNPDVPVLSGPIISNPHPAKGHARVLSLIRRLVCAADLRKTGILCNDQQYFWHPLLHWARRIQLGRLLLLASD